MVVNGYMVHNLVVFVVLWLIMRLSQWGKSFRLDELPEFNRSVLEVKPAIGGQDYFDFKETFMMVLLIP